MNYTDYCISKDISIREAMKSIDRADIKIVFIVEDRRILASLTDGDVRRYLLMGGNMSDNVYEAGNKDPVCAGNESEAAEIYRGKEYIAIPIVDDSGNLEDIYVGNNSLDGKRTDLNIPVVINAGGRGTRLEPFTKILPKPLIPVGELPVIEHIMQQFQRYGCNEFHIIVNYKKELIKAYFADNDRKYDITWYDESEPLGTGGGLCLLKGRTDTTFFFTNCDNLLLSNYGSMLRFHRENNNLITMIGAYQNFTIPYGVIEMGINGSIQCMEEKPEMSVLANTGIYIVEPEVLNDIEDNVPVGFPDIINAELQKGKRAAVYPVSGNDWMDMGQLSELEKMRMRLYGE